MTKFSIDQIHLQTNNKHQHLLYKSPCIIVGPGETHFFSDMQIKGVEIFELHGKSNDAYKIKVGDHIFDTYVAPTFCVGLFTNSKINLDVFEDFTLWLRASSRLQVFDAELIENETKYLVSKNISEVLLDIINKTTQFVSSITKSLAVVRKENEDLQIQFEALEQFVSRRNSQPFYEVFFDQPAEGIIPLSLIGNLDGIMQVIPVASRGVSAIELFFDKNSLGECIVGLYTLKDYELIQEWKIKLSHGDNYDFKFKLLKTITGINRTLMIKIAPSRNSGDVRLLLGSRQPIPYFQVTRYSDSKPIMNRNLAMRVWAGIPGLDVPNDLLDSSKVDNEDSHVSYLEESELSNNQLESVRFVEAGGYKFDGFIPVVAIPSENAVTCHPPAQHSTLALIPNLLTNRVRRISATAVVDNQNSNNVMFAMVVASTPEIAAQVINNNIMSPISGDELFEWTSWVEVRGGGQAVMNLFIPKHLRTDGNIYLATKMKEPGDNSFAWAKFKNFNLVVGSVS